MGELGYARSDFDCPIFISNPENVAQILGDIVFYLRHKADMEFAMLWAEEADEQEKGPVREIFNLDDIYNMRETQLFNFLKDNGQEKFYDMEDSDLSEAQFRRFY